MQHWKYRTVLHISIVRFIAFKRQGVVHLLLDWLFTLTGNWGNAVAYCSVWQATLVREVLVMGIQFSHFSWLCKRICLNTVLYSLLVNGNHWHFVLDVLWRLFNSTVVSFSLFRPWSSMMLHVSGTVRASSCFSKSKVGLVRILLVNVLNWILTLLVLLLLFFGVKARLI